jgi:hypothetical protein
MVVEPELEPAGFERLKYEQVVEVEVAADRPEQW